jgi:hypothetical protein
MQKNLFSEIACEIGFLIDYAQDLEAQDMSAVTSIALMRPST